MSIRFDMTKDEVPRRRTDVSFSVRRNEDWGSLPFSGHISEGVAVRSSSIIGHARVVEVGVALEYGLRGRGCEAACR